MIDRGVLSSLARRWVRSLYPNGSLQECDFSAFEEFVKERDSVLLAMGRNEKSVRAWNAMRRRS